jgi:hypothetical protein
MPIGPLQAQKASIIMRPSKHLPNCFPNSPFYLGWALGRILLNYTWSRLTKLWSRNSREVHPSRHQTWQATTCLVTWPSSIYFEVRSLNFSSLSALGSNLRIFDPFQGCSLQSLATSAPPDPSQKRGSVAQFNGLGGDSSQEWCQPTPVRQQNIVFRNILHLFTGNFHIPVWLFHQLKNRSYINGVFCQTIKRKTLDLDGSCWGVPYIAGL